MLSACATNNATRAPDVNLAKLKTFYVVRVGEDERGIEKLIATRLNSMGYQSTSGDAPKPDGPVDAICDLPGPLDVGHHDVYDQARYPTPRRHHGRDPGEGRGDAPLPATQVL
jgi:hypothetical protein